MLMLHVPIPVAQLFVACYLIFIGTLNSEKYSDSPVRFLFRVLASLLPLYFTQNVKPTVTRGLVIDAGSGGSRLHVYSWQPRIFSTIPPPLSYPEGR